ncbi:MAG: hypothetical protein HKN16_05835 [Saprospiraceae bacterium]|nr:hypothetical protein [Saprospiraceae bacterium]
MKKRYWIILLAASFFLWKYVQYNKEKAKLPSRSSLIQKELDRRLISYTKNVEERCREKVLEEAKTIADSIAFDMAEALMLFDTLTRPPKPSKPEKPELLPLTDSSAVSPLLPADNN